MKCEFSVHAYARASLIGLGVLLSLSSPAVASLEHLLLAQLPIGLVADSQS